MSEENEEGGTPSLVPPGEIPSPEKIQEENEEALSRAGMIPPTESDEPPKEEEEKQSPELPADSSVSPSTWLEKIFGWFRGKK